MKGFHSCKIIKIERETEDCVSLYIEIADTLKEEFAFEPGQYLTLSAVIGGKEVRRSYSLSTAPHEKKWRVGIKKIENGLFSTHINDTLKVGDILQIMPPQGQFLLKDKETRNTYVFFAAGSGITPIMSMVKHLLYMTDKKVILFYGNKSADQIIYREELEGLKNTFLNRFSLYYLLSQEKLGSPWFFGRLNREKCAHYLNKLFYVDTVAQYLICGPGPMIFELEEALLANGISKEDIKYELFNTRDLSMQEENRKEDVEKEKDQKVAQVEIIVDGLTSLVEVEYEGLSILDKAIEAGSDLPYSCKGGVCSTCKAKLIKGDVQMDVNYALEKDEVETGYILTCQAHPRSEIVIVDFDDN